MYQYVKFTGERRALNGRKCIRSGDVCCTDAFSLPFLAEKVGGQDLTEKKKLEEWFSREKKIKGNESAQICAFIQVPKYQTQTLGLELSGSIYALYVEGTRFSL